MNYPLELNFKILALASQIYIRDASGNLVGYVKQKLFKLKEDINVYSDENKQQILFNIKADRVIDFSAKYNFTSNSGHFLGSVKRQGMRSIWKANYEIADQNNTPVMQINEENAWVKVADHLVGELPVIGLMTGYFLHPAYIVSRNDGTPILRMEKQSAFFEGKFKLIPQTEMNENEETLVLLGTLMTALLERSRG